MSEPRWKFGTDRGCLLFVAEFADKTCRAMHWPLDDIADDLLADGDATEFSHFVAGRQVADTALVEFAFADGTSRTKQWNLGEVANWMLSDDRCIIPARKARAWLSRTAAPTTSIAPGSASATLAVLKALDSVFDAVKGCIQEGDAAVRKRADAATEAIAATVEKVKTLERRASRVGAS